MSNASSSIIFNRPDFVRCPGWISIGKAFQKTLRVCRTEKSAENLFVSWILNGDLPAASRCVMSDYDYFPVPPKTPEKKTDEMRAIRYSAKGRQLKLPIKGMPAVSRDRVISLDFKNSFLVCVYQSPLIMVRDVEDGTVSVEPNRREVYYKLEVDEDALTSLLSVLKPKQPYVSSPGNDDPDGDFYRVKLSKSQWNTLLAPLTVLARNGGLENKFGSIGYGDKKYIKEHILDILVEAGHSASVATLGRKCNELILMNDQAKQTLNARSTDEPT